MIGICADNINNSATRLHAHMTTHASVAPLVLRRVWHGSHSLFLGFARFESRTCAALTMHPCWWSGSLHGTMHVYAAPHARSSTSSLNVVVQVQSPVLNSTAWIISRAVQRRCNCSVAVVTAHPSPAPGAFVLTLAINRCVA
jgi:hypothetical protein